MPSVARYTRFVMFGRGFLWLLVAGVIGVVVWIGAHGSDSVGKRIVFTNLPQATSLQNLMVNPRYQGLDAHNQPYVILADEAVQIDENNISLKNVRAEITRHDGAWVALNSKDGALNIN